MPPIARFYLRHTLIGFAAAALFVAALLWLNVANLAHLIFTSDIWALALFMLWFFNGIVFAGVQFGIAVMAMAQTPGGGGPRGTLGLRAMPVRVAAPNAPRPGKPRDMRRER